MWKYWACKDSGIQSQASLQNLPHRRRRPRPPGGGGGGGSIIPTCSSWDRRALASIRLADMNEEQESRSPMATPMFSLS